VIDRIIERRRACPSAGDSSRPWLLGFVGVYTIGAFVHVLLIVAIVLFLVGLLSGRRTMA
jgi:uncharacterized membrane protein YtjA (UPF0391 family)